MKRILKIIAAFSLALLIVKAPGMHARHEKASDYYLRARVVKLTGDHGLCSGTQIRAKDGKDYILSAAHCKDIAVKGVMKIESADGQLLDRAVLAEDEHSDLLLIEGIPNLKGIEVGAYLEKLEHIRTFTHGSGLDTWRSDGVKIMEKEIHVPLPMAFKDCIMAKHKIEVVPTFWGDFKVCMLTTFTTVTDAKIVPGSSGGMVVNDAGQLVGVVSAGDSRGFGYLVRAIDISSFLESQQQYVIFLK